MTVVLAFDRDWTVDVNPHPNREAVPLEWVRYWAHETDHEIWAIGNQDLVEEADIPGTVESIRRRDGDTAALGEQDEDGTYEWWPDRDERLAILRDLFPDADDYIVVDDLDLGYVDGWEHYHAWEFVPAVQQRTIDLETPAAGDSSSGGFDSKSAVESVLQEGYLFELTHRDGEEQRTHLAKHVEPDRPAMTPLRGPPTFWFETLGGGQQISVRLPELVDLRPVPYERVPAPLTETATAALADVVKDDPDSVALTEINTVLDDALESAADSKTVTAQRLCLRSLQYKDDAFEAIADPTLALLQQKESRIGKAVARSIADHAADDAGHCTPYVSDLVSLITPESAYRRQATRCLMEVADSDPAAAVDAVPVLATVADSADGDARSFAVYALSCIAAEFPEQVYPTVETLIDAIGAADDTLQANATTALGRIASAYPDAAEPIVADLADILDADAKRVRNNAVGLLADIAQEHPTAVVKHTDAIAERLNDPNIQARINASIALLRAGEADPEAVSLHRSQLEAALDDVSPEVRANACVLLGNIEASGSLSQLRECRDNDPNETVRERATWAVQRLS